MRKLLLTLPVLLLPAVVSAQETNLTVNCDGQPALSLQIPAAAKVFANKNQTDILTPKLSLHLWCMPNVATPEAGLDQTAAVIKSEFVNFKPSATNAITVAGSPALLLVGPGTEADDGDPGNAEVVLFSTDKQVFAACVHGEGKAAAHQHIGMLALLQTAKAP